VKLEARAILVPASISAEAEPALARLVEEDGRPLHALYETLQPDDFSGWMTIKAAADAQYATSVKGLAGNLRAQSSMIEAGPAIIHHATPDVISD
jgi:monoterpene epsilon-lactone hydrolase